MTLREHVVLGGGAALALAPILGPADSAGFFGASVLIDVDHYWDYLHRNGFRDWSFRRTFEFHARLFPRIGEPDFLALSLFHTAEWFLLVGLAAWWLGSSALVAVLGGMVFHLALDLARLARYRATFSRALSVLEYRVRRRRLVRRGLDPERAYREILAELGVPPLFGAIPRPRPRPERQSAPPPFSP